MGSVLCEHCTAECCHYVALPLDQPETRRDFDDIRWYLMHQGVNVFVEDGDWYLQFRAVCHNLRPDFKCGIYETRPQICRVYKAKECDYMGGDYGYDHIFTEPDDIVAFAKTHFAKQRPTGKSRKTRRRTERVRQNLVQLNTS